MSGHTALPLPAREFAGQTCKMESGQASGGSMQTDSASRMCFLQKRRGSHSLVGLAVRRHSLQKSREAAWWRGQSAGWGSREKGWSWPPLAVQPDKLLELLAPSSPADQSGECVACEHVCKTRLLVCVKQCALDKW